MILVISDTHNSRESLGKLRRIYSGEHFDAVIHAGDVTDFNILSELEGMWSHFYLVKGNGDALNLETASDLRRMDISFSQAPFEFRVEGYGGFVLMHQPYFIEEYKQMKHIRYIIYGHTHRSELSECEGKMILNPGSLSYFMNLKQTYALIRESGIEMKRL